MSITISIKYPWLSQKYDPICLQDASLNKIVCIIAGGLHKNFWPYKIKSNKRWILPVHFEVDINPSNWKILFLFAHFQSVPSLCLTNIEYLYTTLYYKFYDLPLYTASAVLFQDFILIDTICGEASVN